MIWPRDAQGSAAAHGRLSKVPDAPHRRSLIPLVAGTLALAYPVAVAAGPRALAGVTIAAAVGGCALVLARRPSRGLRIALVAIAAWLTLGLGGAFVLHARSLEGFAWVLLVLYLLPLPVIPYLYARTCDSGAGAAPGRSGTGGEER